MTAAAYNVAVAWVNIAGNATLAASSAATNMPVSLLQQEDVGRRFRTGAVTTVTIDLTFSTTQSADTFGILGTNLTAAGIVDVKLSNVALGNSEVWRSNPSSTAGQVDPNYEDAIILASSVKSGWKYCRITLTDTSLTYLEAGFLFISTRSQLPFNYDYGAQRTVDDASILKDTIGGQTKVVSRPRRRIVNFTLGFIPEAESWSIIRAMDLANGASVPVLWILDPSSTNLGRDSIYGFNKVHPVTVIQAFDDTGAPMRSTSIECRERL